MSNFRSTIEKMYNVAEFEDNINFDSQVLLTEGLDKSIKTIWNSLNIKSVTWADDDYKTLFNAASKIHDGKIDLLFNPKIYCISNFSKELKTPSYVLYNHIQITKKTNLHFVV